jgi:tetratricopeptide (TPR) repeat protein
LNAGDAAHALPLAEKAASASGTDPAAENVLGRALVGTGRTADAVRHLSAAWESDKVNPQFAFDYAQALLQAQEFGKAADVLEAASGANPRDVQLRLALGVARYGQRRFDDAIRAFLDTIQLDPRVAQPYLFLGRVLTQAGASLPEITTDYRRWLAAEPRRADAPFLLAKALLAANDNGPEPEALLRRSIQADPNRWESHYELGVLLFKKRDYQQAARELERSEQIDPKQAMTHYHLARVYDRLGQRDRAQAERELHKGLTTGERVAE